jgi:hypothetical protein
MYVIALLLLLNALPESRSGSILATKFSDERIIMAADSRATDNNGHRIDDCDCKILIIGKSLVFVTGGRGHADDPRTHKTIVDATDIAMSVRRSNSTASIEKVATLWGQKMKLALGELGKLSREALLGGLEKDQVVALGVFAGTEPDGRISAYVLGINYEIDGGNIILTTHLQPVQHGTVAFFTHGTAELDEFMIAKTKRARDWNIRLMKELESKHIADYEPYRLIAGVQAAIEWANDEAIGGDVDALILHKGGKIEWLQKKKHCYESPKQSAH